MKTQRALLIVAGAAIVLSGGASQAQTFFGSYNGHDYYLNLTASDYSTARTVANSFRPAGQSYLFSINDLAEETAVTALMRSFFGNTQGPVIWIGLTNELFPGDASGWTNPANRWADGSPVTYTNWGGGGIPLDDPQRIFASYNWNTVPVWIPLQNNGVPASGPNPAPKISIIEVIPSPGAAALLGLGGLVALRRRR